MAARVRVWVSRVFLWGISATASMTRPAMMAMSPATKGIFCPNPASSAMAALRVRITVTRPAAARTVEAAVCIHLRLLIGIPPVTW